MAAVGAHLLVCLRGVVPCIMRGLSHLQRNSSIKRNMPLDKLVKNLSIPCLAGKVTVDSSLFQETVAPIDREKALQNLIRAIGLIYSIK